MKPAVPLFWLPLLLLSALPLPLGNAALAVPTDTWQLARARRGLSWRVGVRPSRFRYGGFSRGSCLNRPQTSAITFVPPPRTEEKINNQKQAAVDFTFSDRPTFWIYIKSMPAKTPVQLTLQMPARQTLTGYRQVYSGSFQVEGTGLVGIKLPPTAPPLQVGESYSWKLAIVCDPEKRDGDIVLESWVQRLQPGQIKPTATFNPQPLIQALGTASDQEKPALYAGLGVWQDAVTALIDLRQKQPNNRDIADDWRNLLTGAQLTEFLSVPVLGVK